MKKLYLALVTIVLLATCKKEVTIADKGQPVVTVPPKTTTAVTTTASAVNADTLANRTQIKLVLFSDSLHSDETALVFIKTADPNYNGNEDGRYMQGLGLENLASIASDGTELAINSLPYVPSKPIGLYVDGRNDGSYLLKVSYETKIPDNLQVWIKDKLTKDSLNLRTGNYQFNLVRADTNTFGSNRFKLVLRTKL